MTGEFDSVSVSPIYQPRPASKAHPYAVSVKVDDVVHVLRFCTQAEAKALREQPVESIVATCEQVARARQSDHDRRERDQAAGGAFDFRYAGAYMRLTRTQAEDLILELRDDSPMRARLTARLETL